MRPQINRLDADTAKSFAGNSIDRTEVVRFRLDGRLISGFAGDTVLSAALASGVDTLGEHGKLPIGLTPEATPAIAYVSLAADPQHALPMVRTPALNGAEFVIVGKGRKPGPLARLFQPGRTLGVQLDDPHALDRPWRGYEGISEPGGDVIVIGGGVAGMSAALAAAKLGQTVTLIEASPRLGGHSGLFGTQEGEGPPEANMAALAEAVRANDAITVLTRTRAFALRTGLVRVHEVYMSGLTAQGRIRDLTAGHIILATGALERLPIFAGNRLPGVMGALNTYELASRYGIWPGRSALIATVSSPTYRLAMLAQDAGITIDRILDSRVQPDSRFIQFTKAYGIRQFPGTIPAGVGLAKTNGGLGVHFEDSEHEGVIVDRLIVCGGWQPDLTLWHVAGGVSAWHEERHRIEPVGTLDGIALCGSAAGYLTRRGCIESGPDAINQLLGRKRRAVNDPVVNAIYETPDARPFIAGERNDAAPAYLDHGMEFLQRPAQDGPRGLARLLRRKRTGLLALSEAPQPLAICDIAAGVDLGLIPATSAGIVAQERVALVPLAPASSAHPDIEPEPPELDHIPAYLQGRFGHSATLAKLVPRETRLLETGALIYRNSDASSPLRAIGVVLRPCPGGAVALMRNDAMRFGLPVSVRDQGQAVSARLEQWSDATLGSLTRAP